VDVPVIQQAKIQAQVLVPLVKALQAELGEERANALVRGALGDTYRRYGNEFWRTKNEKNLGMIMASGLATFASEDALDYRVIEQSQDAFEFDVTGCRYAEFYKELGEPELGFLLVCSADSRAALLYNPDMESLGGAPLLRTFEAAAAALALEAIALPVRDDAGIETGLAALARDPRNGLVVPADIFILHRRELIVALVARHKVPAVYALRELVTAGGLISYGVDPVDLYRRGAIYVDRILRGAKPAELPVQAPIKFELVINLKTSKALGLTIPPSLLALADEVIE
jgi:hypothetical protein